jgi:hypothetical protein
MVGHVCCWLLVKAVQQLSLLLLEKHSCCDVRLASHLLPPPRQLLWLLRPAPAGEQVTDLLGLLLLLLVQAIQAALVGLVVLLLLPYIPQAPQAQL